MTTVFYGGLLLASVLCSAIYLCIWHKHFDANITMVFTLVPIACLGYFLFSLSDNLGEALAAHKTIYIGGSYLALFILLSIMDLCKVRIYKWARVLLFCFCTFVYASVLSIGYSDFYYKDVSFGIENGTPVLYRAYGFMHTVYYAMVITFFLAALLTLVYAWRKKAQVPRSLLVLLILPETACVISYFVERLIHAPFDIYPAGYLFAQVIYIFIANRLSLYSVNDAVIESMVKERSIGYASFDFKYRYLGSNEVARELVPELASLAVDEHLGSSSAEQDIVGYLDVLVLGAVP